MVPLELKIGGVVLRPATVLAPMAGLTDTVFRRFVRREGGCGLIMTEFASSDGITHDWAHPGSRRHPALRYLHFETDEHPISAQLFGANPAKLADAARVVEDLGFDLVDLNLGCPVKKVVRCNGGSSLLRELPLVEQILKAIRAAVRIPFTLKFRSGWSEGEIVAVEVARLAEDCGLDAIALHPRTRLQGYAGRADWRRIAEVKQAVKIPVIGNGDIQTPDDAFRMVAETGCDGVMIGRAAASNPWIFRQIGEVQAGRPCPQPADADRYRMIRDYYQMLLEQGCADAIGKMKQFASYFTHGVRNGAQLRRAVHHAHSTAEIISRVDEFFGAQVTTTEA